MSAAATPASAPEFWLVKIPNFLHDQWEDVRRTHAAAVAAQHANQSASTATALTSKQEKLNLGQPIAHIMIEKKPKNGAPPRMKIVVPPRPAPSSSSTSIGVGAPPAAASTEFNLSQKKITVPQPMLVFGTNPVPPSQAQKDAFNARQALPNARPQPPPEAFKNEGEVNMLVEAVPRATVNYQVMLAARLASAQRNDRVIKKQEEDEHFTLNPLFNQTTSSITGKRKSENKPEKAEKRVRMEVKEIESAILELMSSPQYAYVTITTLAKELRQPQQFVSETVNRLCIRQEDGVNKGLYTLRPEYRLAADDAVEIINNPAGGSAPSAPVPQVKSEVKREW